MDKIQSSTHVSDPSVILVDLLLPAPQGLLLILQLGNSVAQFGQLPRGHHHGILERRRLLLLSGRRRKRQRPLPSDTPCETRVPTQRL